MGAQDVALWCAVPLVMAVVIDSLELLADRAQLADGGLYGYHVLGTGRPAMLAGPLAGPLRRMFAYPAVLALPLVQLAAAAVLTSAIITRDDTLRTAAGVAALIILGTRSLFYARQQLGLDGADQMILVAASAVAAALLLPDPVARDIALYYLAAQLLLSYATAGIAKAVSTAWRSGNALPWILSTIGYGSPKVGSFLARHPLLGKAGCWWVIASECSAPLLILLGTPGALVIIAMGATFHLSVAVLMGLNIFPWSFAAAYPALLFVAPLIRVVG